MRSLPLTICLSQMRTPLFQYPRAPFSNLQVNCWLTARSWQPTPVFQPGELLWTEKPGGLQCIGLQRVEHDWSDLAHTQTPSLMTPYDFYQWFPTWRGRSVKLGLDDPHVCSMQLPVCPGDRCVVFFMQVNAVAIHAIQNRSVIRLLYVTQLSVCFLIKQLKRYTYQMTVSEAQKLFIS